MFQCVKYFSYIVVGLFLFNLQTSEAMDGKRTQNDPFSSCRTDRVYEWCIVPEQKTEVDLKKIATDANTAKNQKNWTKAISLSLKFTQYLISPSCFVTLGELCEQQEKNLEEAIKWHVLAFQTHWLDTSQPLSAAQQWLSELQFNQSTGYFHTKKGKFFIKPDRRPLFQTFINHFNDKGSTGFLSRYPMAGQGDSNYTFSTLDRFCTIYKKCSSHEPYLSIEESQKKADWFIKLIADHCCKKDEKLGMSSQYFILGDYQKAAYLLYSSNSPEGFYNLGVLYQDGKLKGGVDFVKAAQYFIKSNTKGAFFNLGLLHQQKKIENSSYMMARLYYEKAGTSEAYYQLGVLYEAGLLGKADFQKAAVCYEQSDEPEATIQLMRFKGDTLNKVFKFLGNDVLINKEIQPSHYQKCYDHFNKLSEDFENIEYWGPRLLHLSCDILVNPSLYPTLDSEELEKKAILINQQLLDQQQDEPFIIKFGSMVASAIMNEDYDEAYLILQKALFSGVKNIDLFQEEILRIIEGVEYFKEEGKTALSGSLMITQQGQQVKADSSSLTLPGTCVEGESENDSPVNIAALKPDAVLPIVQNLEKQDVFFSQTTSLQQEDKRDLEKQEYEAAIKRNKQPRKIESRFEKLKKNRGKLFKLTSKLICLGDSAPQESLPPFTVTFDNPNDEEPFLNCKEENAKLQDLLNDIAEKPWATKGTGKPEVLKGLYKGHKGCLSRRINHEDRLVYKAVGSNTILILSWEGHYGAGGS